MSLFGINHIIKAGNHYDDHILSKTPFIGSLNLTYYISFNESWIFKSQITTRLHDVSKLFGGQYGLPSLWKWIRSGFKDKFRWSNVHWNSVRFGGRWNDEVSKVEILPYAYYEGVKNWNDQKEYPVICQVDLNKIYRMILKETISSWIFTITDAVSNELKGMYILRKTSTHSFSKWGFLLGLYFGGNDVPLKDITVRMSKNSFK